jgi:hypothetical protein
VVPVEIDRRSGKLATESCPGEQVTTDYFLVGTEPTESCPIHPDNGFEGWMQRMARGLGDFLGGGRDEERRQEPRTYSDPSRYPDRPRRSERAPPTYVPDR